MPKESSVLDAVNLAAARWVEKHRPATPKILVVDHHTYGQLRFRQRQDMGGRIDDIRGHCVSTPSGRLEIMVDSKAESRLDVMG